MENLKNITFTHEFLNIKNYLYDNSEKNTYIELDNNFEQKKMVHSSISYCIINCSNYKKTIELLEYISKYLENGAILLFCGWFNNIKIKDLGPRDAVLEWLNDNELIELIDFPIDTWREKAFIFRRNNIGYVNWSD